MPAAIPLTIAAAGTVAAGGAIAATAAASGIFLGLGVTAWAAIGIGVSIAGTLAQTLLAPQPPKPKFEDGSQSVKQAVPPRTRCYGRYRLGGTFIYYVSTEEGDLKTIVCHVAHEIDDSIDHFPNPEEHWLADEVVTVNDDGKVDSGVYDNYRPILPVSVKNFLGAPGQDISGISDEWSAGHHGEGLACTFVGYSDMKPDLQQKVFPSGAPAYRATLRGAKIYDPRQAIALGGTQDIDNEATWKWSDNAALVLLDYMTRLEAGIPVGFGLAIDKYINVDSFRIAADTCDEDIPRKPHDPPYPVEKRWRAWGAYDLTEDRKSVLSDMLDACGGRLTQGPDGRLGLSVGAGNASPGAPAASVTIDDDQILEYDLSAGRAAIERVNEVRATYVSADQDWAEVEAGIQQDQDSIDRNGIESSGAKLRFVPSEGQAQRAARFTLKFGNPSWSGKVRGTLALLDAWGERWIRLQLSELEVDQIFEISSMRLDRDTMSVEMQVTSYDGWWDWDPATDEADPAPVPDSDSHIDDDVPVPGHVAVTIEHRSIDGRTMAAIGVVSWDAPSRPVFIGQVRYRPVTTPTQSAWQFLPAEQDEDTASTPPLVNGQGYEAQARFLAPRGSTSDWSGSALFTAVADPNAPGVPLSLTAMVSGANVNLSVTAPNSANQSAISFYRNSLNNGATATQIAGPIFTGPNGVATYQDTPGPGDWYYFATSENWSGVPSAKTLGVLAETAPPAPAITSPSGPLTTYNSRPVIQGTSYPLAAIKLFANAVQVGTATANGSGIWSATPSSPLGTGANSMTATAAIAGNESVASGSVAVTVVAIDADAWAWIVAMTVTPPFARQTLINTLVGSLKTAGVWSKLDALYLLAAHDAQAARLNAKAPGSFVLTAVSSPVFTVDAGYKGTGLGSTAGGYLSSTFAPSTAGGQWALNSAHMGVYVRTACSSVTTVQAAEVGVSSGASAYIFTKHATAGNISTALDDATISSTAAGTPNGLGHFCTSRTASTGYAKYHEGVAQAAATVTSTGLPAASVSILRATPTTYSDAELCAAHWGAGLTATEAGDLRTAVHTYLAAVGAVA
jgi:hypothetical protein